jgi:thiol-disulfide isomerase/thioredoxin
MTTPFAIRNLYWIFSACVLVAWLWYSAQLYFTTNKSETIAIGKHLPSLQLIDLKNQPVSITYHNRRWRLLHFWATWCDACKRELPSLEQMAQKLRIRSADNPIPLKVLAISVDMNISIVQSFLASQSAFNSKTLSMQILLDPAAKNAAILGTQKYPETYLIDPNGILRYKWIGPYTWDTADFISNLRRKLAVDIRGH